MNKADLDRANQLSNDLRRKEENYNEMLTWRGEHDEATDKDLSLSKVGHGWIRIPSDKKQKVLDLVHDIVLKEFKDADKRFKDFQPQHRDKL